MTSKPENRGSPPMDESKQHKMADKDKAEVESAKREQHAATGKPSDGGTHEQRPKTPGPLGQRHH
jgi:hypothetical protein